ncbi:MAG: DUF262 domain-containing protein [Candidatus ainarchaeum sp.]|nr:DUF262 domain-containing protein [Candidatus ainarchaeum sp.]
MSFIKTYPMPNSAILRINSYRDIIDTAPPYQRNGEIWTIEKKQLLIDSILNDYDIPKLYFNHLTKPQKNPKGGNYIYAIIDGRQRLEAIWAFINGDFALSEDFKYLKDSSIKAHGLTYFDLAKKYPSLKILLDSFTLPIVLVETDDTELIEDMFSRLNEAVPLNAAEKRNALGGPLAKLIRETADHPFFIKKVKFSNSRYQYREVSARLLFLEDCLLNYTRIFDTKKSYLDQFVLRYKKNDSTKTPQSLHAQVCSVLDLMVPVFADKDDLIKAQSFIVILYLFFKEAQLQNKLDIINRNKIQDFVSAVTDNRRKAEESLEQANFDLLEFDRMSMQGTNDAASIKERLRILCNFFGIKSMILEKDLNAPSQ